MNTNSNSYTIIYASIMVVIVAFLLAFVSSSLKEKQYQNVEQDTKKQILAALTRLLSRLLIKVKSPTDVFMYSFAMWTARPNMYFLFMGPDFGDLSGDTSP